MRAVDSFGTAEVFFPDLDGVAGTPASMTTFAVARIARPFGAFFLGHYGDKISATSACWFSPGVGEAGDPVGVGHVRPGSNVDLLALVVHGLSDQELPVLPASPPSSEKS